MIRNSFIFLSGIGEKTEGQLWRRGVTSWADYEEADLGTLPHRIQRHRDMHTRHLGLARRFLERGETAPFARWLPPGQAWRLLDEAGDRALYLDIETTGLAYPQGRTTVVGAHLPARGTTLLVRGQDLTARAVQQLFDEARLIVTFNGKQFDVPFLRREFGVQADHVPHMDLMYALRRVGIRGGLKRIEVDLGIGRDEDVQGVDGYEAVQLWKRWERGDHHALETLLTYNREDVLNMVPLASIAYDKLRASTFETHRNGG